MKAIRTIYRWIFLFSAIEKGVEAAILEKVLLKIPMVIHRSDGSIPETDHETLVYLFKIQFRGFTAGTDYTNLNVVGGGNRK